MTLRVAGVLVPSATKPHFRAQYNEQNCTDLKQHTRVYRGSKRTCEASTELELFGVPAVGASVDSTASEMSLKDSGLGATAAGAACNLRVLPVPPLRCWKEWAVAHQLNVMPARSEPYTGADAASATFFIARALMHWHCSICTRAHTHRAQLLRCATAYLLFVLLLLPRVLDARCYAVLLHSM